MCIFVGGGGRSQEGKEKEFYEMKHSLSDHFTLQKEKKERKKRKGEKSCLPLLTSEKVLTSVDQTVFQLGIVMFPNDKQVKERKDDIRVTYGTLTSFSPS